jgi:hypothetical protein
MVNVWNHRKISSGCASDGWLSWQELLELLDEDALEGLRPLLTHRGLDGLPCIEQGRLDDLLALLGAEGGAE